MKKMIKLFSSSFSLTTRRLLLTHTLEAILTFNTIITTYLLSINWVIIPHRSTYLIALITFIFHLPLWLDLYQLYKKEPPSPVGAYLITATTWWDTWWFFWVPLLIILLSVPFTGTSLPAWQITLALPMMIFMVVGTALAQFFIPTLIIILEYFFFALVASHLILPLMPKTVPKRKWWPQSLPPRVNSFKKLFAYCFLLLVNGFWCFVILSMYFQLIYEM